MAILKCKICGGDLEVNEALSVYECQHCGVKQTIPSVDDEDKVKLYNRANALRLKCEFDKATGVYESIVASYTDEAEAYWGLVLCKFGIEYIEDSNGAILPTCHRTVPVSIMNDEDFDMACTYANADAKEVYREEAKVIDGIQKKILQIASAESPYDVFICYKEKDDATGERTDDSNIAQDIYTDLTQQGYRVFYARITLREVAGSEYEPYIYAALSSAKVMIAIGTKFEYYDAVWVKNEWSRFISMMHSDKAKVLIPCYKNMDGYDIPKELRNMQALDISDLTFLDSLKSSIKRIVPKGDRQNTLIREAAETSRRDSIVNYFKRINMFLNDRNITSANEYCEKILDLEPENGQAYLYKFMIEAEVYDVNQIKEIAIPLANYPSFAKAVRFGDEEQKKYLLACQDIALEKYCNNRYSELIKATLFVKTEDDWKLVAEEFKKLGGYKKSNELAETALKKAELVNKAESIKSEINTVVGELSEVKFEKHPFDLIGFSFAIAFFPVGIFMLIGVIFWGSALIDYKFDIGVIFQEFVYKIQNEFGWKLLGTLMTIDLAYILGSILELILKPFICIFKNSANKKAYNTQVKTLTDKKSGLEKELSEIESTNMKINFIG